MKFKSKRTNNIVVDIYCITIAIIFLITYIFIKDFSYKSEPILINFAEKEAIKISTILINNSISKVKIDNNIITTDSENDIVTFNFDNKKIQEISYLFTENLLNDIKKLSNNDFDKIKTDDLKYEIPIGIIYNLPMLIEIGPKIVIKTMPINSIETNVEMQVKDYGINSAIIQVLLKVKLHTQIILPFNTDTYTVNKSIILESKIIQGNIPKYYSGSIDYNNLQYAKNNDIIK